MNNTAIKNIPLLICFLWNAYLTIYAGLDGKELPQHSLMYFLLILGVIFLPLYLIFEKWKSNPLGLFISGIFLLAITAFIGWGYISSGDPSRVFILGLNWVVLWFASIIILLIPNKSNSNQAPKADA